MHDDVGDIDHGRPVSDDDHGATGIAPIDAAPEVIRTATLSRTAVTARAF